MILFCYYSFPVSDAMCLQNSASILKGNGLFLFEFENNTRCAVNKIKVFLSMQSQHCSTAQQAASVKNSTDTQP
ncbi:hypothetical protein DVA76_19885, partial [Acinetobacter baumannii]